MGARSGNNYLSAIRKLKSECWIDDVRILDPITHPRLVNYARGIASLYDAQIERPAAMTYRLAEGDRVGLSFMQPRDAGEMEKRGAMLQMWAELRGDGFNYAPEVLNSTLAAMAAASDFFEASHQAFARNLEAFYRAARRHDWCMTSNLTEFHYNCLPDTSPDPEPLKIVEHSGASIHISGAIKLTMPGSLAEKLLVLSSPRRGSAEIVFAADCNAPGLRFVHQQSSSPDLTCLAIFDQVVIPEERIFLRDNPVRYREMMEETGAAITLRHHAAIQSLVRAETLATAGDSDAAPNPRAEAWRHAAESLRACLKKASVEAEMNRWGILIPARAPLEEALDFFRRINRAA